MKCIVTGGTGMIGRQVVDLLLKEGHSVKTISLDDIEIEGAEHIKADLTDICNCKKHIRNVDAVFHLAGIKASAALSQEQLACHFVPALQMNVNVLDVCRNVEKVVFTSSIGAYADRDARDYFSSLLVEEVAGGFHDSPMDFAGWAKRMAELQIHSYRIQYGVSMSIVRPSNVYGPGDTFNERAMVIPSLIYRACLGNVVTLRGDGRQVRDFVYSRDAAEGIVLAMQYGTGGQYVNLGSGIGTTIRDLADTLKHVIYFEYYFDGKEGGYPTRVMDISLARKTLGYNPTTTLPEGLEETVAWYLEHRDEHEKKKDYFK